MREPTLEDRVLLAVAVLLFGLGILASIRGKVGWAQIDFAWSAVCFAVRR